MDDRTFDGSAAVDDSRHLTGVLDADAFAILLGADRQDIIRHCGELLKQFDFHYEVLQSPQVEATILEVLRRIDGGTLSVSGSGRREDWEAGWRENLEKFVSTGYDLSALSPQYISKYDVVRLFGRYIRPRDKRFEVNYYTVYRQYLFRAFLEPYSRVYEFGCGTGYNLALLHRLLPEKKALLGLDWTESAVQIANALGSSLGARISGRKFNYFQPDPDLEIPENTAIMTFNSLEQIGKDFRAFLDFLLAKRPALCLNSEPILEMYDDDSLLDYLAIRYHKARNYLEGYYAALEELASEGKIKIVFSRRVKAGNLFHEGYSIVIWRPCS